MLIFFMMCGVALADDIVTTAPIDTTDYTQQNTGVLFNDSTVENAQNFNVMVTDSNVTISLPQLTPEVNHVQIVGIPLSQIPEFDGFLTVNHYNEAGVYDYSTVVTPYVENDVAYVNVSFSTVVITPYISQVKNWDFVRWSSGSEHVAPDDWIFRNGESSSEGAFRSTDAALGSYSYGIIGRNVAISGELGQQLNLSNGNYILSYWAKITNKSTTDQSSGTLGVDVVNDSTWASYAGVRLIQNTNWVRVVTPCVINDNGHNRLWLRIFVDSYANTGSTFLIDGVMLSPNYNIVASENDDGTHLYQTFPYTPPQVYNESIFFTKFQNYDLSKYTITGFTVTCDGVPLNAYVGTNSNYDVNGIYFDVSHLSAAQHTITVVITTNPLIPKASFTSQIVPTPNQPGCP
jgi:hypothetical protein